MSHDRHTTLRRVAHILYRIPGVRPMTRMTVRAAIQYAPLSRINRQRLYNFFAADTAPAQPVLFSVRLPQGQRTTLRLDLHDDLSRQWYYWGYRGYEREVTRLLCRLVPHKTCVFDIGANIGYHTLLIASLLHQGSVHAFEPWVNVFTWLDQNVRSNHLGHVRTNQIALSDTDGVGQLLLPADNAFTNASLVQGFTSQDRTLPIPTQRFDTYCREQGITRVDLIKLDVEGAELQVLYGMGVLLERWRPDIICEVLDPYAADLDAFFRDTPYRKFLITSTGLQECQQIVAHPQFRDYYLSCEPISAAQFPG